MMPASVSRDCAWRPATVGIAVAAALALASCTSPQPTPTHAVCPPGGTTLTYDNFGQPFMDAYCTRCHASTLHGKDRNGAPLYHDFDSLTGILMVANHIDWWAGAGPDAVNTIMPPGGDKPTIDERYQLSEWLACELDALGDRPDAGP